MMQYSRQGIYRNLKRNSKKKAVSASKNVDWVNIFLFVLLGVVVILFVLT